MQNKHFFIFAICLFPLLTHAGNDNYPIGARSAGIANASVCVSDLWAIHHNQASLAYLKTPEVGLYHEQQFFFPGLMLNGIAVTKPFDRGVIGFVFSSFGYTQYRENKFGLALARKFGPNFSAGMQWDYYHLFIGQGYGTKGKLVLEAGTYAKLTNKLSLGAHIYNITRVKLSSFYEERIPTIMKVGIKYDFSPRVFWSMEVEKDILFKPILKTGVEYHALNSIYLRIGFSTNPEVNYFGMGWQWKKVKLDLAYSIYPYTRYTHIGVSYAMNRKS